MRALQLLLGCGDRSASGGNPPRSVVLVVAALALGVLLLAADGIGCDRSGQSAESPVVAAPVVVSELAVWQTEISDQVASILETVSGAGQVQVWVQLASGPTTSPIRDEDIRETITEEQDAAGGSRTVTESHSSTRVITRDAGTPALQRISAPVIVSAVIVSSGARDPVVQSRLRRAVTTLLDLPAHRVIVLPGGGE